MERYGLFVYSAVETLPVELRQRTHAGLNKGRAVLTTHDGLQTVQTRTGSELHKQTVSEEQTIERTSVRRPGSMISMLCGLRFGRITTGSSAVMTFLTGALYNY